MKIAFFTDTYWPQINGVSENIDTVRKELEDLGHEIYIVAPKSPGYKEKNSHVFRLSAVKIVKNPEQRLVVPIPEKDFGKLLLHKFDLVHIHSQGTAGFLGWEIAQLKDLPCVTTYHTLLNRYTHYLLKGVIIRPKVAEIGSKIFCNLCDIVVAPTQRVKDELISYGVRKEIVVLPGGIDLERFEESEKLFLRSKIGLSEKEKIILYLGRLGKEKNIAFVIKSLEKILKREKDAYFAIVGDGPERDKLEKLVHKLGLEKKVLFTGFLNRRDVPKIYKDSDIFVFASDTETQGLTIPESMMAGLPVVVMEDQAFEEIVFDGKTGLVAKNTREDFAKKVQMLLKDEELRCELGENGKKLVEREFSAKTQAEKLVEVYKKAVEIHVRKRKVRRIVQSRISVVSDFLKVNTAFTRFKEVMKTFDNKL